MKDPLKDLKRAMNQTIFQQVHFTDAHKEQFLFQVKKDQQQHLEVAILRSLYTETKTGFTILEELADQQINLRIHENEGLLYIYLHQLESKKYIRSSWREENDCKLKYYRIEKKGKQRLAELEKEETQEAPTALKLDWEGGLKG